VAKSVVVQVMIEQWIFEFDRDRENDREFGPMRNITQIGFKNEEMCRKQPYNRLQFSAIQRSRGANNSAGPLSFHPTSEP
jgi:hypothetical protein